MLKTHPSMLLMIDIDEALDTEELRLEINRCYAYIGSPVVRTHARAGQAAENTLKVVIQLGTRHYVDSSVEGADELWEGTLKNWLRIQFHKLANQMVIFNRRQREEGKAEIDFKWIEVNLENGKLVCRMRLDSISSIGEADSAWIDAVRQALNAGKLGEGVTCVEMPSAASYEAQEVAGLAAKAEREAEAARAAEAEAAAQAAAEAQAESAAEEAFLESPELLEELHTEQAAEELEQDLVMKARIKEQLEKPENEMTAEEIVAKRIEEEAHLHELMVEKYAVPEADFALEFSVWDVIYADGTVREYDSAQGVFTQEA
jgi:hypothetical protein